MQLYSSIALTEDMYSEMVEHSCVMFQFVVNMQNEGC